MNKQRIIIQSGTLLLVLICLVGCQNFLDVAPEDKYTEDQVFDNEENIKQALTGIYISLTANELYGASLTQTTVEFFAQRFPANYDNQTYNNFIWYNFYGYEVQINIAEIWAKAYSTILKTNKFLENLDHAVKRGVITQPRADLLSGEATAIRAFVHFDLLRLFGPVDLSSEEAAIPYYTKAAADLEAFIPAGQVMENVLADLAVAQEKLRDDAVRQMGIVTDNNNYYTDFRNRRLNFYAVAALLARVQLYAKQPENAHATAQSLLEEIDNHFPWLPYENIVGNRTNPDRVFSTEVIFGLENQDMYKNYNAYFSPELETGLLLSANPDRLSLTFEANQNDYRYTTTWLNSAKGYRTFQKFADIDDKQKNWRFLQPLIRKSELYYILAETTADPQSALAYLNEVRYNRGLTNLDNADELTPEIQKEYQKEFYGEGQLFFYYKRLGLEVIPDGSSDGDYYGPQYVVPIPDTELIAR